MKKILVVDDDKRLVEVYRRALERAGYEVICAYNGREGLDILKKTPADLIILDLEMPWMRGDKFLKILRADSNLKETKVLVISSHLYKSEEVWSNVSGLKEVVNPTKVGLRAAEIGRKDGAFEMQEKLQPIYTYSFVGQLEENEPKFKRRISVALVEKVKEILSGKDILPNIE